MANGELATAVAHRTVEIVDALRGLDERALRAPSELPGWSRLTIACHLRYGAEALHRMTSAALAGEPVSYYPGGRDQQRPGTLEPRAGEDPQAVVSSLAGASDALHEAWLGLDDGAWTRDIVEPEGQRDLGPLTLGRLPLLRLTEVEAHGIDLGLGLADWSDVFVGTALPFRLDWLNRRRANHRAVDARVQGSWLLVPDDGPSYLVAVDGDAVTSHPAGAGTTATAVIEGSSRDLLALLLGRPCTDELRYDGDAAFGRAFSRAFPGP